MIKQRKKAVSFKKTSKVKKKPIVKKKRVTPKTKKIKTVPKTKNVKKKVEKRVVRKSKKSELKKKKVVKSKPARKVRAKPKRKKLTIKQRNDKIWKSEIINEKMGLILDENGFKLIQILMDKRKMSEFRLSEVIGIKVNKIRSILYKLQTKKIVEFSKRRDKRKGWYIYTWELKPKNIVHSVIKDLQSDIDVLEKKYHIRQEGKEFFSCNECGVQTNILKAMETNYLCPYCDSPMKVVDVENIKKDIISEIEKIKEKIKAIEHLK